jgi:hypothetical protein
MLGMLVMSVYLGTLAGAGHHDDVGMMLERNMMDPKGCYIVGIVGYDDLYWSSCYCWDIALARLQFDCNGVGIECEGSYGLSYYWYSRI